MTKRFPGLRPFGGDDATDEPDPDGSEELKDGTRRGQTNPKL